MSMIPIEPNEIKKQIINLPNKSSSGYDGISNPTLEITEYQHSIPIVYYI